MSHFFLPTLDSCRTRATHLLNCKYPCMLESMKFHSILKPCKKAQSSLMCCHSQLRSGEAALFDQRAHRASASAGLFWTRGARARFYSAPEPEPVASATRRCKQSVLRALHGQKKSENRVLHTYWLVSTSKKDWCESGGRELRGEIGEEPIPSKGRDPSVRYIKCRVFFLKSFFSKSIQIHSFQYLDYNYKPWTSPISICKSRLCIS